MYMLAKDPGICRKSSWGGEGNCSASFMTTAKLSGNQPTAKLPKFATKDPGPSLT